MSMSKSPYRTLKVIIRSAGAIRTLDFALCVSIAADCPFQGAGPRIPSDFLTFIGETVVTNDELSGENRVYARACAGVLQIAHSGRSESTTRIDTTLFNLYPACKADGLAGLIRLQEEPNMHLIGDRCWHSSLVMAYWLMQNSAIRNSTTSLIIELGSGLGTVSLATALVLRGRGKGDSKIIATDLPEIVKTTLSSNIRRHPALAKQIHVMNFTWGEPLPPLITSAIEAADSLTVLACDVLYNRDSHPLLVDALIRLHKASNGSVIVYIAYKHRISGDGDFFSGPILETFVVDKIYTLAGIEVYCLKPR